MPKMSQNWSKMIKRGHLKAYKNPGERSYRIPCDEYHKSQAEVFKI